MTTVRIANLYPLLLSAYGDHGNLRVLQQRLGWYDHDSVVVDVPPDTPFPPALDLLFIGGGTDHGQAIAAADLTRIADRLRTLITDGTPALAICGGYQLSARASRRTPVNASTGSAFST